jgi:Family of unknown function (DUF5681)
MPKTGRGNPKQRTQFKKGMSGNKNGRPKGSKSFSTVLMAAARDEFAATIGGKQRRMSKKAVLESTSAENGGRAFVQHIESCIEGSLSPAAAKTVTPDDKAALEQALSALRPSFDELAKCFFDPVREQKPALCEHGYHVLWSLIGAAFAAGSRGTMSESA